MKEQNQNKICLIPIALWFVIIPLIVKVKFFENPLTEYVWYSSESMLADFFLYHKSLMVTITGVLMLLFLAVMLHKMEDKETLVNKDSRVFLPIFIYLFLVVASSLFSEYGYFCTHGMPDQFETVWNLIAYIIAMVYCYYVIVYQDSDKSLLGMIFVGAAAVGLICVLQYFKVDIYRLIYAGDGYSFTFAEGSVYGPFYNINYVGYYTLLFVPIFVLLLICCKNWKLRAASAVLTIALLIALVGAKSITAEIALVIVAAFAIVFVLLKNVKAKKLLLIPLAAIVIGGIGVCIVAMPRVNAYLQASNTEKRNLENIFTEDAYVEIDYKGEILYVQMVENGGMLGFLLNDHDAQSVAFEYMDSNEGYYYYTITDPRFEGITLTPAIIQEDPVAYGFMIYIDDKSWCFTNQMTDDGTYYYYTDLGKLTKLTKENVSDDFAPLENVSYLASGRGYIWNKTIAILKDYLLLGSGADTYALVYPNDDFVDKYNNGYNNMILTKPHCLYLQVAVQSGVLSLICFLVFYVWYFFSSLRLYFRQKLTTPLNAMGFAVLLGTMGYMISGIANDSTITISPLYWGFMGIGIGINHRVRSSKFENGNFENGNA